MISTSATTLDRSSTLLVDGIDVNVKDMYGHTPIMLAARECHKDIVDVLLRDERVDLGNRTRCGRSRRIADEADKTKTAKKISDGIEVKPSRSLKQLTAKIKQLKKCRDK